MLDENFQLLPKCLNFLFQLHSNCVYMSIILSEFLKKYIQFYELCYFIPKFIIHILDENLQFYMKMSPHLF